MMCEGGPPAETLSRRNFKGWECRRRCARGVLRPACCLDLRDCPMFPETCAIGMLAQLLLLLLSYGSRAVAAADQQLTAVTANVAVRIGNANVRAMNPLWCVSQRAGCGVRFRGKDQSRVDGTH